jgi:hypothetical protein
MNKQNKDAMRDVGTAAASGLIGIFVAWLKTRPRVKKWLGTK